jgi:hypothetical protein
MIPLSLNQIAAVVGGVVEGDVVLVKASREARLDEVAAVLTRPVKVAMRPTRPTGQ